MYNWQTLMSEKLNAHMQQQIETEFNKSFKFAENYLGKTTSTMQTPTTLTAEKLKQTIDSLYFAGLEFYPTDFMVDTYTVQKRKHRQKRINKKWLRVYGYKTIAMPSKKYYVMGNRIVAHPNMIDTLKELLKQNR